MKNDECALCRAASAAAAAASGRVATVMRRDETAVAVCLPTDQPVTTSASAGNPLLAIFPSTSVRPSVRVALCLFIYLSVGACVYSIGYASRQVATLQENYTCTYTHVYAPFYLLLRRTLYMYFQTYLQPVILN